MARFFYYILCLKYQIYCFMEHIYLNSVVTNETNLRLIFKYQAVDSFLLLFYKGKILTLNQWAVGSSATDFHKRLKKRGKYISNELFLS